MEHRTSTTSTDVPAFPIGRTCPFAVPDVYEQLRDGEPISTVTMSDGRSAWILTRHDDVRRLMIDPRFSSDRADPGFPAMSGGGKQAFDHFAKFLISMDGEEHSAVRKPLISQFSMRAIAAFRPRIQQIVDEAIDGMLEQGPPVDLVAHLSSVVPSRIIAELMGVTPAHLTTFYELAAQFLNRETTAQERDGIARGMRSNMDALVELKEREPGEDILSREIARQRAEQGEIDRPGLASLAQLMLLAGHESTAEMISLGVVGLLSHPDQLRVILDDPSKTPAAIDELLRYFSVVEIGMARVALEDVEIRGVQIKAGDGVIASNIAANHDPSVFPDPGALDLQRDARQHVAQGFGAHQCIGMNLARTELAVIYDTLFKRVPTLRLESPAEELPFKYDGLIFGLRSLPVSW
ncbi:cytochrome P450 [Luteipulveratus mongoliensis]|uniref:Cytochrome P450 n=1 Tax=Luteipulveratus mongoliensis TaxID=571913 RepID=A0A0K1JFY1_9MICO|nr:cytochrome P450 [Luteipulveratus mongoliensis]AKU15493.1 cytochrome P450 [Luteipulveratus mongoliensis]